MDGRSSTSLLVHTDYPDVHKFMCGISPNYIHAQDATHMALTIDKWESTFGAVHDSFSTHASDVENLLALTKNVFVDMYDVDNYFDKIQQDITGGTDTYSYNQNKDPLRSRRYMTVTTSSRNPAVRNMIEQDGDEETKAFVREAYGIPDTVKDWKDIDDMAERIQKERNEQWRNSNKKIKKAPRVTIVVALGAYFF